jgi:hypothetical protein
MSNGVDLHRLGLADPPHHPYLPAGTYVAPNITVDAYGTLTYAISNPNVLNLSATATDSIVGNLSNTGNNVALVGASITNSGNNATVMGCTAQCSHNGAIVLGYGAQSNASASLSLATTNTVQVAAAGASDAYLNVAINGVVYKLLLHT